jgi:hypothetical protein
MRAGTVFTLGGGFWLLLGTACWAATVEPVGGHLAVSRQGQGFQTITEPGELNVGDRLMVSPNGSASVVYPDGCRQVVQPGLVMTIAPISPCVSSLYAQTSSQFPKEEAWRLGVAVPNFADYQIYYARIHRIPAPRPAGP